MAMSDKQRIIDLQKQVRIARTALQAIASGRDYPHRIAEDALEGMMHKDAPAKRAPLAGVLGWEKRHG